MGLQRQQVVGPHQRVGGDAPGAAGGDACEPVLERLLEAVGVRPAQELDPGDVAGALLGVQGRHDEHRRLRSHEQQAQALVGMGREAEQVEQVVGGGDREQVDAGLRHRRGQRLEPVAHARARCCRPATTLPWPVVVSTPTMLVPPCRCADPQGRGRASTWGTRRSPPHRPGRPAPAPRRPADVGAAG